MPAGGIRGPMVIEPGRSVLSQINGNVSRNNQPAAGKKRKAAESGYEGMDPNEIDCDGMYMDMNCDQVRRKIRNYLDSGEKVGDFCKAIGVSNNSLNTFLRQSGRDKGSGSATFHNAWEFFKRRELAGLKMPTKKQKATAGDTGTQASASNNTTTATEAVKDGPVDISGIHLPGEELDAVPVYDSCDEVRRKINAHLKKPNITQAQFCRDLQAQLHSHDAPSRIQSNMLTAFRGKKGPRQGNTSSVYYAAYVYFEKLRLQQGSKKTKHRMEMEDVWPAGADREHPAHRGLWCFGGKQPYEDKFGKISIY